jgi:CubicO group peptidase (beta-lactamase class C family)
VVYSGNAQSFATRADKYLTAYAEQGKFMGAALVARDGRVLFERGYGSADLAWDVPITPQTKFNIASLTKQYDLAALSFGEKVTPAPRS